MLIRDCALYFNTYLFIFCFSRPSDFAIGATPTVRSAFRSEQCQRAQPVAEHSKSRRQFQQFAANPSRCVGRCGHRTGTSGQVSERGFFWIQLFDQYVKFYLFLRSSSKSKSAPVSVNRSESYKERLSHRRSRNNRRKTSDPSFSKTR